MTAVRYAALDIGGTKVAAALADAEGTVLHRGRVPTPEGGGQAVLAAAARLLDGLAEDARDGSRPPGGGTGDRLRAAGVRALGVGAPGVVDPATGRVVSATDVLPGWSGTPVRDALADLTGLPVAVANDVRAMGLGEARRGAGAGFHRVLHVSVGTGVGGALTTGGRLDGGAHGTAGELAHLLVPERGPVPCGCGRRDHLEAAVSGPAIAATGDPGRAGALLGRALAGLLAVLDPDAVVVGGGVAQVGAPFLDAVTAAFRAEALPPLRATPILPAALGTDAPLTGAALLARAATDHERDA
ncbi:ROK family protein [Actinomadura sp. WAC 06369]|uniref:ROK family protein n=1 Tax=Actinomadura sp. WAC 06369 TaxID=2203193 RepID=UPI000F799ACA|nr:ROK family protein [Actinomadura sp. WAC 06369]RSN51698.1 ROK family protein [Actinomadura sp. WAC 06369]